MEGAEVKENPDISYIKRDDIGVVIAKGLARLYKVQPDDPVEYLANWLLNFSNVKSHSNTMIEKKQKQQELRDRKDLEDQNKMRDEEESRKKEKETTWRIDDFRDKVANHEDLSDMLQEFTHYLKEFTGATGVYIGKLIKPNKPIKENDNDKAHENPDAPEIIKYIHASQDHGFMINKTLTQEQGLTHDIFKPLPQKEDEGNTSGNEGQDGKEEFKEDPKSALRHLFVSEVVRENRIHYFKVPKLGSYLAIELKYNSWLTEETFEKAYEDFLEWEAKREGQSKRKQDDDQDNEDREEDEEDREPEENKQIEEVKEKPFDTIERKFVVWLDTMGKDIQFTQSQIDFALENVKHFSDSWTKIEYNNLKIDIRKRFESSKKDREYIEGELGHALQEEEDKFIDEYFDSLEEPIEEEAK